MIATKNTSPLDDRLTYLFLADIDYLSARLLILHGLVSTGLPKASEAFEKLIKLFIILAVRIRSQKELTEKQLKKHFGHSLPKLFAELKRFAPVTFNADWDAFIEHLGDCYALRYPDGWREPFHVKASIDHIDECYCYLRNGIILSLPPEELDTARVFGGIVFQGTVHIGQSNPMIDTRPTWPLDEILKQSNRSFSDFNIKHDELCRGRPFPITPNTAP
jgi:hypothetical protein